MTKQRIEFRTFSNHMILYMPDTMEDMDLPSIRKLLKFVNQERWRNEESMKKLFSCIQEIKEDLKAEWDAAESELHREWRDPKVDANGDRIADKEVRAMRREHNRRLKDKAKSSKQKYERFLKREPKLKDLQKQYGF